MKILIVDDELLVRIGIKSCIEWNKYGMEIVGEASDGIDALEQIRLLHPDVVLLDIKMPNMDGIELMQKIKEEKMKCKMLILSGFDDFYHVKEAMKLGAMDYLHKPCMSSKDIIDALLNIKVQIEDETSVSNNRKLSSEGPEKSKSIAREIFLREFVDGNVALDDGLWEKLKENYVDFKNSKINCLVFCIKDMNTIRKRYAEADMGILQSSVSNIMKEVLSAERDVVFFTYDRNTFVIVTGTEGIASEKRIYEGVNSIVHLTVDALKQFLDVNVVVGVSSTHISCKEIKSAFGEALKAMKYGFYAGDSNAIYYSELKLNTERNALIHLDALIEKVKTHLSKQEYREFKTALEELFVFLARESCLSGEEVKKLSNGLLFLIKQGKEYLEEMELINNCETLLELRGIWNTILADKLLENPISSKYQACSYLVKSIIKHIDENYAQDITLNMLSESFGVSPNYISKLFKEETGDPLFHYLNEVRVKKAKSFLRNPELKIYEVGYKAGFKSTVHFNIVFNKLVGLSPKQYRDSL